MNTPRITSEPGGATPVPRPAVPLYASPLARPQVLTCVLNFRHRGWVVLRTPGQLPPPCPVRLASLRQERAELQRNERIIAWLLQQYAEHYLLPDACHENGLRAELDATRVRLRALAATLAAVAGEAPH